MGQGLGAQQGWVPGLGAQQGWEHSKAGSTAGLGQEGAPEGTPTCFCDFLAFFILFNFISCFLIRFFFWVMRRSTSTPH